MFQKEPIDEDFLWKYKDFVQDREWEDFPTHKISIELIEKLADRIFWSDVFLHDRKDEAFIRRNIVNIEIDPNEIEMCWWHIATCQTLSEQFFRDFEDKIDFQFIAKKKDLNIFSDAFVEDFKYILDKSNILKTQKDNLSKAYLKEYKAFDVDGFYKNIDEKWLENYLTQYPQRINWESVSKSKAFSDAFITKYWKKFDLRYLPQNNKFTEELVRKIAPQISEYGWDKVFAATSFSQAFLEEMLEKYSNKLHVGNISYSPSVANLSEDFVRKYKSVWNWKGVGQVKQFTEPFLREFENKWDWNWNIAHCQRVSEAFIRDFAHKFSESGWSNISQMQTLSEDFMREFADKLDWMYIFKHQKLSDAFKKEFKHKLDK